MNYDDELFFVEHLVSNVDTELYLIQRKKDGVQLKLHVGGTSYRVVDLNSNIQKFLKKQIEYGKRLIDILNEDAEVVIKSFDVENNMYKPLNDELLKTITNKFK
ncbi:hypothetical protein K7P65_002762 [Enterococcus faecalis]|uniref:hypothetical protein n=1 Tax=Enterococcus faecalis TaxID=1351 RepID=UPI00115C8E40|nr:hypothetical protein [Enterococcus faecalis]EIA6407742.1 hypothetical protein [Enterococcus faecalis]EIA6415136.1 hypothetical protein [Enterococcus faecalis]EIA6914139.1 hypothetical protein [Enterococcus faecalis]EJX8073711.1 hypothetical protein [Enterococcus faecalis]